VQPSAGQKTAMAENNLPAHNEKGFSRLVWIALEPLLRGEDCPVCAYGSQSAERYLKAVLYEGVTDSFQRARLRRSLGLCALHAWKALEFREGLYADHVSMAVIYQDIAGAVLTAIKAIQRLRSKPAAARIVLKSRLKKKLHELETASRSPFVDCPACEHQRHAEERALSCLVACVTDESVAKTYCDGAGLCLGHLALALEASGDGPSFEVLLRSEVTKFEKIRDLLHALQERFDVRSDARPTREEALAPAQILRKVLGRRL